MGLMRLLRVLFRPKRQMYRYERSNDSYHPISTQVQPIRQAHSEPLRQVEEGVGQKIIRGHCWVIDGDTIVINKVHIRLAGIDAPEIDHRYGQSAKRALIKLCRGQVITALTDGSTSYERAVATCTLEDGRDLSAEMVRLGLALDWGKHSGGRYRHLEIDGVRKKLWRVEARHKGKMPPKTKIRPDS